MKSPQPDGTRHRAGDGPVVLDIGGDIGALLVRTPPQLDGAEIEISKVGGIRDGKHVAVHPRLTGSGTVHAAVFGDLTRGRWQLWGPDGRRGQQVAVIAGDIVEIEWVSSR